MAQRIPAASTRLAEIPREERPRERLLHLGPSALTTSELLAILLVTGSQHENVTQLAERVLVHCGGIHGLAQTNPAQLASIHGLGPAKTAQIAAALELGARVFTIPREERPIIQNAHDASQLVMDMGFLQQEHIRVILLDTAQRLIAMPTVYIGTVSAAMLRTAELFRDAITRNATSLILVHNHPSGDPSPSPEDVEITSTMVEAGRLLDINIIDHLIVAGHQWRSLREMRLGF